MRWWRVRSWPAALRASVPIALPTAAVGVSFGLLAAPVLGTVPAVVMSALVWSGTAQFAALSILTAGGGIALAGSTALLANARFLPMGFAVAPSMTGRPVRRFLTGALLADASFAIAHRDGGRFDVAAIAWAAPLQYLSWLTGTALGVAGADAIGDPARWGLDTLFPVFYLSLLLPELFPGRMARHDSSGSQDPGEESRSRTRNARPLVAAALAAVITLGLIPITPPGVPVLAAASAALIGLLPPRRRPLQRSR